jgi:hypothetical protein
MTRQQLYGKDSGERTPPTSQLLGEYLPLSDVAPLVVATSPANLLLASSFSGSTSQAPDPSLGGAARDTHAGIAHSAFQPTPGHVKNNGQTNVPLDAAPPTPLAVAATASTSSQVVDPFYGPTTKAVLSTKGAFHALQPVSGHVQNDGRNSSAQ